MIRHSELVTTLIAASAATVRLCLGVGGPVKAVGDQAIRAATSAALNAVEGEGRAGRARADRYRTAYGEAGEADVALQILVNAGCLAAAPVAAVRADLDRGRRMLFGRLNAR